MGEAAAEAKKCEESQLQNRILFHASHRMGDEAALMKYHQKLADTKLDQLSLAAIHYLRNHFQEATDVYKRLLLENRDDIALNVYVPYIAARPHLLLLLLLLLLLPRGHPI